MEYAVSGPLVIFKSTLGFAAILLSAYGVGSLCLRNFFTRLHLVEAILHAIFSVALGLFALSLWVFVVGNFGWLTIESLSPFFVIGIIGTLLDLKAFGSRSLLLIRSTLQNLKSFDQVLLLLFGSLTLLTYFGTQAPATANDALAYHLYLPKLYVEKGAIFYHHPHPRALWPFMMEMLFTAGLLLQGTALAQLLSWVTAVLTIAAVPAAAAYFGFNRKGVQAAFLLILCIPAIWMQSLYAYVDNAMMLYTFLAFIVLTIWQKRGYDSFSSLIAALFVSALVSIKYFALFPALILLGLFGAPLLLSPLRWKKKCAAFALPIGVVTLLGGIWYFRSWYLTGNPVFPFMANLFGGNGFSIRAVGFAELPKTFTHLLLLPWNLAFKVDVYGGEPIGSLFLATLPLLPLTFKMKGFVRELLLFSILFTLIWYYSIQHARFLFPVLPFFSLLSAVAISRGFEKLKIDPLSPATLLLAFLCVLQIGLAAYYPIRLLKGAFALTSAESFLGEHERSYPLMKGLAPHLTQDDKLLFLGEPRLFYTPVSAIHFNPAILLAMKKRGLTFTDWLAQEGITHIVSRSASQTENDLVWPEELKSEPSLSQFELDRITEYRSRGESESFTYILWHIRLETSLD